LVYPLRDTKLFIHDVTVFCALGRIRGRPPLMSIPEGIKGDIAAKRFALVDPNPDWHMCHIEPRSEEWFILFVHFVCLFCLQSRHWGTDHVQPKDRPSFAASQSGLPGCCLHSSGTPCTAQAVGCSCSGRSLGVDSGSCFLPKSTPLLERAAICYTKAYVSHCFVW